MIYKLIYGIIISILYSYIILPGKIGDNPKINITIYPIIKNGMLIIPFNKRNALHIHHWVIFFILCILSNFIIIPKIIQGFAIGLFVQGVLYKDSFNFIVKNPYNI